MEITYDPKNTIVDIDYREEMQSRDTIPDDYHCECNYCRDNFLGEVYHTSSDNHYTQYSRNRWYVDKDHPKDKHICPGHWSGYRYAVHKFTKPGDWVLDPTVGTGTAVVESMISGRNGVGIELEYSHITRRTVELQNKTERATGEGHIFEGDARDCEEILTKEGFQKESFDMIINGTPYPVLGGRQSDSPPRNSPKSPTTENIYYQNDKNVGVLSGENYWNTIREIYKSSIEYLKPGGKFITLIKDPTQKKQAFLLHKMVTDVVMESNDMKYVGCFIHRHMPYTLFMRTYLKMYPEVKLPLFQTGIVLEKN